MVRSRAFCRVGASESGFQQMTGFFARQSDTIHLSGSEAVSKAMALDFLGGIAPGDTYVVLKTRMTSSMVSNAGIPRTGKAYNSSDSLDALPPAGSRAYPTTGHAITASGDGRKYPESIMKTGTDMPTENNVTVMEFKNADGSKKKVTKSTGEEASEWELVPHPTDPDRFQWIPLS